MNTYLFRFIVVTLAVFLSTAVVHGQKEDSSPPKLGGPDQAENRIDLDKYIKQPIFELSFLQPYFDFKDSLKSKSGLSFGVDYTTAYFGSNSDVGTKNASGGIARLYGSWELVGRKSGNSGALVYKIEHRHKYGEIAIKDLSFNIGYAGLIGPPFNADGFRTQNLYWRQRFAKGRVALVAGFLDVTDFFDVYALASPWMHFSNFNFSTGVATVNVPNDGYLGVGVGGWITDRIYIIAGIGDINADPGKIFKGFESLFNTGETFKNIEVGITSAKDYMFLDNIHVAFWQRDESSATGDPSGWGIVASGTKYINDQVLPFFRFAYTKDAGSLLGTAAAVGVGYQANPGSHLFGFAYSWGKVNENTFGSGLDNQHVVEVFYRLQLSSRIAITPDLQFLMSPALTNEQGSVLVWGIRGRISL